MCSSAGWAGAVVPFLALPRVCGDNNRRNVEAAQANPLVFSRTGQESEHSKFCIGLITLRFLGCNK